MATNNALNLPEGLAGQLVRNTGTGFANSTSTFADTYAINSILYNASANTVSGLASVASSVLTTSGLGVPTWSLLTGFADAPTNTNITSMTGLTGALQAPTGIKSSTGLNLLTFTYTALAVNYFDISNAGAGTSPKIIATGTDASIIINLFPKNGPIVISDSTNTIGGAIRFNNAADTTYTELKVAAAQATTVSFTLPAADGSANTVLKTDGSGVLSFGDSSFTSFTPGWTGFSVNPTTSTAGYYVIGKVCFIIVTVTAGTSNANTFTMTGLPFNSVANVVVKVGNATDNSIGVSTMDGFLTAGTSFIQFNMLQNPAGFTASGSKGANLNFFYQIA